MNATKNKYLLKSNKRFILTKIPNSRKEGKPA